MVACGLRMAMLSSELTPVELHRGQVDRNADLPQPVGIPCARLPASFAQHPLPDGHDQARLLGDRDEPGRRDQAEPRVHPPDQRLHPANIAALHVDARLVVQHELALLDRPSKVALEGDVLRRLRVHVRRKEAVGVPPRLLRVVHRHVRVAQQALHVARVVWEQGHADTRRDGHVLVGDAERLAEGPNEFARHDGHVRRVVDVREHDGELVL
jgi:hypothetical protein